MTPPSPPDRQGQRRLPLVGASPQVLQARGAVLTEAEALDTGEELLLLDTSEQTIEIAVPEEMLEKMLVEPDRTERVICPT